MWDDPLDQAAAIATEVFASVYSDYCSVFFST
jgi:hypothetical protein